MTNNLELVETLAPRYSQVKVYTFLPLRSLERDDFEDSPLQDER